MKLSEQIIKNNQLTILSIVNLALLIPISLYSMSKIILNSNCNIEYFSFNEFLINKIASFIHVSSFFIFKGLVF